MKKSSIFGLSVLFFGTFISTLNAQFVQGYITKGNGDTVNVFFSDKVLKKHFTEIKCRKSLSSSVEETYSASLISGFYLSQSNEYFFSKTVTIDKKPIELTQLESNPKANNVEETVFVKLLIGGEANLYSYQDENSKKHYLFSKKNNPIQELIYLKYFATTGQYRTIETYKLQLDTALIGCQKNDNSRLDFEESGLRKAFERYNACFNNEKNYAQKFDKSQLSFKVFAGYSNFQMGTSDPLYEDKFFFSKAPKAKFSNSKGNFSVGGSIQIMPRVKSSPFLYEVELMFSKRSYLNLGVVEETFTTDNFSIEMEFSQITIQPSVIYRIKGIVEPFIRLGVCSGFVSTTKNKGTAELIFKNVSNDIHIYEPFAIMSNFNYGVFGGTGISIKKISAEIRFEASRIGTSSPPTNLDFTGIYGLVAYRF
jgi:hypothetical protein